MIVVGLFLSLSFILGLFYLYITTKDPVFIFTLFFIFSLTLACYLGFIPVPNIISLYENQNKSTNFDSQETPTVNTQESSQVKVKENTMNLNCTALENGEYLCKKPK